MKIRQLIETDEFEECVKLQKDIWKIEDILTVPTHLIRAFCDKEDTWGIILGAFEEKRMVGFVFCIPTSDPRIYVMHMIGVLPEYQKKKIGKKLMKELLSISKNRGVEKIVWTYDPLESVNAYLYFHKMKSVCRKYAKDYYILKQSKTHAGFPADRFKMELFVDEKQRESLLSEKQTHTEKVEIPGNFQELKDANQDNAGFWRDKTRPLFQEYINENNYIVVDFEYNKEDNTGQYILCK